MLGLFQYVFLKGTLECIPYHKCLIIWKLNEAAFSTLFWINNLLLLILIKGQFLFFLVTSAYKGIVCSVEYLAHSWHCKNAEKIMCKSTSGKPALPATASLRSFPLFLCHSSYPAFLLPGMTFRAQSAGVQAVVPALLWKKPRLIQLVS